MKNSNIESKLRKIIQNKNSELDKIKKEYIKLQTEYQSTKNLLNKVFDYSSYFYFICDAIGKYTFINKAVEKVTGYKKSEVLGKNFLSFLSSSEYSIVEKGLVANRMGKVVDHMRTPYKKKNGEIGVVEIKAVPAILDKHLHVICMGQDITEKEQSVFEVNLLRTILNQSEHCMFFLNAEGYITYVNNIVLHSFGMNTKKMYTKLFIDLHDFIDSQMPLEEVLKRIYKKKNYKTDIIMKDMKGNQSSKQLIGKVVKFSGEKHILITLVDIIV